MIFCFLLLFAFFPTALAGDAPTSSSKIQQTVINEYDALKQLSQQSDSSLEQRGFSAEEIFQIRNYREIYINHITSLQSIPNEVLSKHEYSAAQILAIQTFNGSEEQMALAAASLDIHATTASFTYPNSEGRTTGRLAYSWHWNGLPVAKMRDMVAASWNDWVLTDEGSSVSYFSVHTGEPYTTESATYTNPTNNTWNGGGHKFNVAKSDNLYYAKSGSGHFDVESDGVYQKDFLFYIEYGHATLSYNIGFSVSVPGGAAGSISFSAGTTEVGSDSGSHRW